jgi:hypothetical protein
MCFKSDIFVCTKIRLYLVEKIKEKEGDWYGISTNWQSYK